MKTMTLFAVVLSLLLVATAWPATGQIDSSSTPQPQDTAYSLIAFTSEYDLDENQEIYVMNPDGSNLTNLTQNDLYDIHPLWLADGSGLIFSGHRLEHDRQILPYLMGFDGSDPQRIELATQFMDDGFRDIVYMFPSPDHSQFAFVSESASTNEEIYVVRDEGSLPVNLTHNGADDDEPDWSPDGTQIAFSSERDGNSEIYVMNADGSNPINLTHNDVHDFSPDWSPDGSKIAYSSNLNGNVEIFVMNADGSNPVNLTNHEFSDWGADWSPDGSQIVFFTNRDGNHEIYVMNADGSNPVNLTNHEGDDSFPVWSPWLDFATWSIITGSDTPEDVPRQ